MKFTDNQKSIIKSIFEGNVYDLCSFIESYYENCKFMINEKDIQKKKNKDFEIVKNNINKIMAELNILMKESGNHLSAEKIKKFRKTILNHKVILEDFQKINNPNESTYTNFDYINKELYYIEDYSLFDDFIYVVKYLESENYIVLEETARRSNLDIFRYFIRKDDNKSPKKSDNLSYDYNMAYSGKVFYPNSYRYGYYMTDADYLDFKIFINREKHSIYIKYFRNMITVKPELGKFIERNYINTQEYSLKTSHRKTNIAIGVTIIVSIASLLLSLFLSKSNTEFWKKNEVIELENHTEKMKVLKEINQTNKKQLLLLEELLNKNIESGINNTETIIEKIDEIIIQNERILKQIEYSKGNNENN